MEFLMTLIELSEDFLRTFLGRLKTFSGLSRDFIKYITGLLIALPCFILTSTYLSLYILPLTYYLLKKVVSAIPVVFLKIYLKCNQNFFHDVPDHLNDHKVA